MDLSEYERMQENKRLLEDSLKNERVLREEITKLQQEKLEVLEAAKMKVVKVNKTTKEESLLKLKYSKHELAYILKELQDLINGYGSFESNYERIINIMAEKFFKRINSSSDGLYSVTTYGLDEIKKELREEIIDSIDADIKRKLEDAKIFKTKEHEFKTTCSKLETQVSELTSSKNKLLKLLDEKDVIIKSKEEIINSNTALINSYMEVVKDYTIFNSYHILNKLKKVLYP